MKIDPLEVLLNKNLKINKKLFLISGNETTLMEKIKETIFKKYKEGAIKENIDTIDGLVFEYGFFEDRKIFVGKNCKDINEKNLNKIKKTNDIFIFIQENSTKTKKIKSFFIKDKDSLLIDCYELDRESKIKAINYFLSLSKIEIQKDLYWMLVDKLDNKYVFLENTIRKIIDLDQKDLTLENIKKLLTLNGLGKEKIFFSLLRQNREIIGLYREKINTTSDVNEFYYHCKFYCQLIIDCENLEEYNKKIPLYLFRERGFLSEVYKKYNSNKKQVLLKLLFSTEKILRKQNTLSLIAGLRFFLNIKKITVS